MHTFIDRLFSKVSPDCGARGVTEKEHRLKIALCALLLEIAHGDDTFTAEEKSTLIAIVRNRFGLSEEETLALLETAEQERTRSVDIWHFTDLINENYTREEKIGLVGMLWDVVYADQVLDKYEDYLMHRLAKLLHLEHSVLIEEKLKARKG